MAENQLFDEKALEVLFRAHFDGLCRFAMGYVKDDGEAREIVQDAFVSLWEKRDTIDPSKPVKSYLSSAVRNKCLNHLRDHKKFSGDLLALENLSEDKGYDQPDKLVGRSERQLKAERDNAAKWLTKWGEAPTFDENGFIVLTEGLKKKCKEIYG